MHLRAILLRVLMALGMLSGGQTLAEPRVYFSGFESVDEFDGFYIVPQNYNGAASHDLSSEQVHSGTFAHKGWIYAQSKPSTWITNNNHRGYPTIQLYKLAKGAFQTPVKISFWVWLDMDLSKGEWFSFATLDHTTKDTWDPVLVNLSDQGFVHLMHVPKNGMGQREFQTDDIKFPMRQWVELTITLHFDPNEGFAEVYQDGQLVSRAKVSRGGGQFTQAHFGLYAPPSLRNGVVFNDDLTITEITK